MSATSQASGSAQFHQAQAEQRSAIDQLRGNPRLMLFMAALALSTAVGVGIAAWYTAFARQNFGATGVGGIATTYSLVMAACGVPAGMLVDRFRPQRMLLPAMLAMAVLAMVSSRTLRGDSLSLMLSMCALEAIVFTVLTLSIVKCQAALVPETGRGAASLIHLAVVAIGGVVGIAFTDTVAPSTGSFAFMAAMDVVVGVAYYLSVRSSGRPGRKARASSRWGVGVTLDAMRRDSSFRGIVLLQLALAFALPTQLVNLYIADYMHEYLAPTLAIAGFVAMGLAGAILLWRGMRPGIARNLRWNFSAYALLGAIAIPVVAIPPSPLRDGIVITLVVAGTFTLIFGDGLVTALLQQLCPDEIRGRITGTLSAVRKLLVALGVTVATTLSGTWNTQVMIAFYLAMILVVLAISRGFRTINAY